MAACPICTSRQVITLISPRQSVCGDCGSTWVVDGGEQRMLSTAALIPFLPTAEARDERPVPRRRRRKHHKAS